VLVFRLDEQTLVITGLNVLACELLQQIPVSAEEDDATRARLYSSPTRGGDPELDRDWSSYVEPDLRRLFQSAMDVVREDLADFPPSAPQPFYTLMLPIKNLGSWINALNQARLALAARYELTEEDMEKTPKQNDTRALAITQIHFYGELQSYFLAELGGV
jgi:hypothetical protein